MDEAELVSNLFFVLFVILLFADAFTTVSALPPSERQKWALTLLTEPLKHDDDDDVSGISDSEKEVDWSTVEE